MKAEAAALAAKAPGESSSERIDRLQRLSAQQNILSILHDRLGAQQQLDDLYRRWGEQVELLVSVCAFQARSAQSSSATKSQAAPKPLLLEKNEGERRIFWHCKIE